MLGDIEPGLFSTLAAVKGISRAAKVKPDIEKMSFELQWDLLASDTFNRSLSNTFNVLHIINHIINHPQSYLYRC